MIDLQCEQLVSVSEACRLIPSTRPGKRLNIATLYRWSRVGCRGHKLELIRIGGGTFTSREAIQRFAYAITTGAPAVRTTARRDQESQRAAAELTRLGVL